MALHTLKRFLDLDTKLRILGDMPFFRSLNLSKNELTDVAKYIQPKIFKAQENIITQDSADDTIYFIFQGSVDIIINGCTTINEKKAGDYFGEIAALFPQFRRTATIRAKKESVIGEIQSQIFINFLNQHQAAYRDIAFTLAQQLAHRNTFVREFKNPPTIFIGSSTEGRTNMELVKKELEKSIKCTIRCWNKGVFDPSKTFIECLENIVDTCDFGIIVLTSDDIITIRDERYFTSRDNLIFELGLCMGKLSRDRTFYIVPENDKNFRLPTDLDGITRVCINNLTPLIECIKKLNIK